MKIVFMDKLAKAWQTEIGQLKTEFPDHEFLTFTDKESAKDEIGSADVLVARFVTDEEIDKAKSLKAIVVPWAGVNALPWDGIKKKGIKVSNTHGNASIVAERAIALCLAVTGKVVKYHNDLSRGIWHGFSAGNITDDIWTSIQGKTCSIIGLGSIGLAIAKMLGGFDCKVVGFKKHRPEKLPENVDEITDDLKDAIEKGEFVFVALPLTKETENMMDWPVLSKMGGKFLINVSRGEIISEEDLYRALKEGILAGAAIDVWYRYPSPKAMTTLPSVYPIHEFPNVVVSPHVSGGLTAESRRAMIADTMNGVRDFIKTGKMKNEIDPDQKY